MSRIRSAEIRRQLVVDTIRTSDHGDYFRFARRTIRALARRVGDSDPDDLQLMLELQNELKDGIARAVRAQRDAGFSWSQIAEPLGMTRQAAQARWGIDDDDPELRQYPEQPVVVDYTIETPSPEERARMALDKQLHCHHDRPAQ